MVSGERNNYPNQMLMRLLYKWQYETRLLAKSEVYRLLKSIHRDRAASPVVWDLSPRRILLVIAGLIGDTVMSTPVILESRRLWPTSSITLLGRRRNCELLSGCPLIDSFKVFDADPFSFRQTREVRELKRWIKAQEFDVAMLVLGDQYAHLMASAGVPVRVGRRNHVSTPCLTHTYDFGSARAWGPSEQLGALRCLGLDVEDVPPRLWLSRQARGRTSRKLNKSNLGSGEPYVVIHPYGSKPHQWWPIELVEALSIELESRYKVRTVLVGDSSTSKRALSPLRIIDMRGKLEISELMALMEGATLNLSTDSGPFHVAGALRRPVVGLFRECRPEHASHYPSAKVLFGKDSFCEGRCEWDRCATSPCRQMRALSVEEVLAAVGEALK